MEGGGRPESVVASVSSSDAGERNLSVEGFERNRVNNQTRTTSKLLFLPPVCARNLHVLFMSRSLPRFTVSAIYGRSSFSSYYRSHLSTLFAFPPSPFNIRRQTLDTVLPQVVEEGHRWTWSSRINGGESSDGRYAGKWPENSIPLPSILPFFRKILPPLLRSHNASKYVS